MNLEKKVVSGQSMVGASSGVVLDAVSLFSVIDMTESDSLLQDVVSATVDAVDPERIILFGSRARGDARPDSDLDLLVVEREPFAGSRSRKQELKRIRRALWRFRVPIDVLIYSRDEIEEWRSSAHHVIGRSLREGVTLYERH